MVRLKSGMDSPGIRRSKIQNKMQDKELEQKIQKMRSDTNNTISQLAKKQELMSKRHSEHLLQLAKLSPQNSFDADSPKETNTLPKFSFLPDLSPKSSPQNSPRSRKAPVPFLAPISSPKSSPRLARANTIGNFQNGQSKQSETSESNGEESSKLPEKNHQRSVTFPLDDPANLKLNSPRPGRRLRPIAMQRSKSESSMALDSKHATENKPLNPYSNLTDCIKSPREKEMHINGDVKGKPPVHRQLGKTGNDERPNIKPQLYSKYDENVTGPILATRVQENGTVAPLAYRQNFRSAIRDVFDKLRLQKIIEKWQEEQVEERELQGTFTSAKRRELESCRYLRMPPSRPPSPKTESDTQSDEGET